MSWCVIRNMYVVLHTMKLIVSAVSRSVSSVSSRVGYIDRACAVAAAAHLRSNWPILFRNLSSLISITVKSRAVYRSQYISIKFSLHKQSLGVLKVS